MGAGGCVGLDGGGGGQRWCGGVVVVRASNSGLLRPCGCPWGVHSDGTIRKTPGGHGARQEACSNLRIANVALN